MKHEVLLECAPAPAAGRVAADVPAQTVLYVGGAQFECDLAAARLNESQLPVPVNLQYAGERKSLFDYLAGAGEYSDRSKYPYPDWVLLKWRLPDLDYELALTEIRANPATAALPVVVLYYPPDDCLLRRAFALGANVVADGATVSKWLRELAEFMSVMHVCPE